MPGETEAALDPQWAWSFIVRRRYGVELAGFSPPYGRCCVTFPIADWVAHHARNRPQDIALQGLDDGQTRSWAALEQRVARLAGALLGELGLRPGDRVAVLADGNIRVLELQFACVRAGLTMVPLNFRLTVAELSDMCRRLSPALMITDRVWRDNACSVALEAGIGTTIDWDGPLSVFETLATDAAPMAAREDMHGDEVPLILFTSGSTGAPKAATCTLEAMVWQAFNQAGSSRVAEARFACFCAAAAVSCGRVEQPDQSGAVFRRTRDVQRALRCRGGRAIHRRSEPWRYASRVGAAHV
jgi:acyl-CoA synthetase (AMP-forming)/AMP-acid ligase II